jgi:hypothetical protein
MLTDEQMIGAMERGAKFLDPHNPEATEIDAETALTVSAMLRALAAKYRRQQAEEKARSRA